MAVWLHLAEALVSQTFLDSEITAELLPRSLYSYATQSTTSGFTHSGTILAQKLRLDHDYSIL